MFAKIAVDTYQDPTKKLFTYSVPNEMEKTIKPGIEVLIPFGKRSVKGYVWNLTPTKPPFPTKPIKQVKKATFTSDQIELAWWMSYHYAALPIDCLKCQLPGRGERHSEGKKNQIETLLLLPYAAQVRLKAPKLSTAERETTLVGSRSTVFAQLPNLKKIIIEEPENWAYKDERAPYYHAKDVAQKRAELEGLKLELRHLVPRVEDVTTGNLNLQDFPFPAGVKEAEIEVVDMRKEHTFSRLGSDVIKALKTTRKALLYTNSREAKEEVTQILKEHALDVNRIEITGPQIFSRVGKAFDCTVMIDTDTLFNLPDFRSHEKLLLIITKIKKLTKGPVFIQTNSANHPLFANFESGDFEDFYRRELEARKPLLYPPFGVLAKLEISAKTTAKVEIEAQKLHEKLSTFNSELLTTSPPYPPYSKTRGKAQLNIAVKAKSRKDLERVLAQVPPTWRIIIDPESLL